MRHLSIALVLVLVGCDPGAAPVDAGGGGGDGGARVDAGGEVDASLDDAALADAGVDANVDAFVPPPLVTVIVTEDDAPQPGAVVVYYDASGTMLGRTTTGADGRATFDLPEGGTVVAIPVALSGPLQSYVWSDVAPGDELPIVRRPAPSLFTVPSTVRVPTLAGSARWQVDTECGIAAALANPQPIALRDDCTVSDVVVSHFDASSELVGTTVALDHAITPGTELDLSAITPRAAVSASFDLVGLTSDVAYASLTAHAWFGSVRAPAGLSLDVGTPTGRLTATGTLPDATGGRLIQTATLFELGGQLLIERHGAALSDIDLALTTMPVLVGLDYAPLARRVTLMTAGAGPVVSDGTYVRIGAASRTGRALVWHLFSSSGDVLVIPSLPTDLADGEVPTDAGPTFMAYRFATPSTPAEVRQRAYTLGAISDLIDGDGDLVYSPFSTVS